MEGCITSPIIMNGATAQEKPFTRSQLLAKGYIFKRKIKVEDISAYESITVFNAMINFKSITLSTEHISV